MPTPRGQRAFTVCVCVLSPELHQPSDRRNPGTVTSSLATGQWSLGRLRNGSIDIVEGSERALSIAAEEL